MPAMVDVEWPCFFASSWLSASYVPVQQSSNTPQTTACQGQVAVHHIFWSIRSFIVFALTSWERVEDSSWGLFSHKQGSAKAAMHAAMHRCKPSTTRRYLPSTVLKIKIRYTYIHVYICVCIYCTYICINIYRNIDTCYVYIYAYVIL